MENSERKNPAALAIALILVAIIGIMTAKCDRNSKKIIELTAEDYSRLGGITPEGYMGIAKVVNMDGLGTKYRTVYHGITKLPFSCESYKKIRKFKNFPYCSDTETGRMEITILSDNLPEQKIFQIMKWDIK